MQLVRCPRNGTGIQQQSHYGERNNEPKKHGDKAIIGGAQAGSGKKCERNPDPKFIPYFVGKQVFSQHGCADPCMLAAVNLSQNYGYFSPLS